MKAELINSLNELSKDSIYKDQLTVIIKDLRKAGVYIPYSDYENVIKFVLVLAQSMPKILENHPNDQALKNLCLHCIDQLNITAEIKSKFGR